MRSATFACTLGSRKALVGLFRTLTLMAAPAPTFLPTATTKETSWKASSLAACTVRPAEEVTTVLTPIEAWVVTVMTLIPAEPATPFCEPTAVPNPCVEKSFTWGVLFTGGAMSAVTLTPAALITSLAPMVAVLVTVATLRDTAAPMEFLSRLGNCVGGVLTNFPLPRSSVPAPMPTPRASARARALLWLVVPKIWAVGCDVIIV